MRIIKNRKIVRTEWLPDTGAAEPGREHRRILALDEWLEAAPAQASNGQVPDLSGVLLEPGDDPEALGEWIDDIPVIAINAENFADGRIYSLAIELRRFYRYQGEIRGIGAIFDNLSMMEQCGFDAFALKPGLVLEEAMPYFTEIGLGYPFVGNQ